MLGLTFATPILLIGIAGGVIPVVLHLLSSVRAKQMLFPTLRFVRISMEKTAHRRRIRYWLLLLLRCLLLGLLAICVAEPISSAVGGWFSSDRSASVVILDNSMSMGSGLNDSTRFALAKAQAAALLSGENKPNLGALIPTNGGPLDQQLVGRMDPLRKALAETNLTLETAPIVQRVLQGAKLLNETSEPRKTIYLFTDMQRVSLEGALEVDESQVENLRDIHLMVVNPGAKPPDNVGITDLRIAHRAIVNRPVEISATLLNSSQTDRVAEATLLIEGKRVGQPVRQKLTAAGGPGSSTIVRFYHTFTRPGPVSGQVLIDVRDDLDLDNVRRFALNVGDRIKALVVRGESTGDGTRWIAPQRMLLLGLNPFEDESPETFIDSEAIDAEKVTSDVLDSADIAFFCEVPRFTGSQAQSIASFVRRGRTAVFFLGGGVDPDNYNDVFIRNIDTEGGLLPAGVGRAVGRVGPDAPADPVGWVDLDHPYFRGLYENLGDYGTVVVRRHYRLDSPARSTRTLIRLSGGDPMLVEKPFGKGRVVLCTTSASPPWTNLPTQEIFVGILSRMSLLSRPQTREDNSYLPGSQVTLRPELSRPRQESAKGSLSSLVTLPPDVSDEAPRVVSVALRKDTEGGCEGVFTDTSRAGVYRWEVVGTGGDEVPLTGLFVVNPDPRESDLEPIDAETFRVGMRGKGIRKVYVGTTVEQVNAAATSDAKGENWWDLLAAVAILLLVVETVLANRTRSGEVVPPHRLPAST